MARSTNDFAGRAERGFGAAALPWRGLRLMAAALFGGLPLMAHPSKIVACCGPDDPLAFHGIPARPRWGDLDVVCPTCQGRGQWNRELDLASQRSKRTFCDTCDGRGWLETGHDMLTSPDIEMTPEGYPRWVTRLDPPDTMG